jgi:hypothetical protein
MKPNFQSVSRAAALLLAVWLAPGFRPVAPVPAKPISSKTAAALSSYFRKDFAPLKVAQIETMNAQGFETWLRQSTLPERQKTAIRQYLKPMLNGGTFTAISVKNAQSLQGKTLRNVAIIQVPNAIKNQLQGSSYVNIFADANEGGNAPQIDVCQYIDCYCSSTDTPGSCVSATQFNKNCPPSECPAAGGTCECGGGGGGGTNLDQVFQTLNG